MVRILSKYKDQSFIVITCSRSACRSAKSKYPETVYEEKTFGWQPYGGAPAPEEPLFDFEKAAAKAPKLQLPVKRGLGRMIIFSILTLGIYPMVIWSRLVGEVNMVASRYDGERSMSFFGMLMLSPLTLGIHSLVWMHKLCRRIGTELQRRNINSTFGPRDFWLWNVLGSLILVGPFIFLHKLMKATNKVNQDFNLHG